jgi:hypothetical protein
MEDDEPPRRRMVDSRANIERIANDQITERFQAIGIDDSTFDHRQASIANFRYLNEQREMKDSRDSRFKKSIGQVIVGVAQQMGYALLIGAAVYIWQIISSGHIPSIFK